MVEETAIGGEAREFPPTRWTMIVSSRADPQARRQALEALLGVYWKPLYFYVRRKGLRIEAAKDAIQGFFAHLLEQEFLERADPAKGRFRHYLRTSIDNYLHNQHEHDAALKRGGGVKTVSLDFEVAERDFDTAANAPESALDREWAVGVMERALGQLRREFEIGSRKGRFDVVLRFFQPGDPPSYGEAAAACGMTEPQFKAFLHRTRERFRLLVRGAVQETVTSAGEATAEMEYLVQVLKES